MPKGGYGDGTRKPSTPPKTTKKKVVPVNKVWRSPERGTIGEMRDFQREDRSMPQGYQDPFNGVNPLELMLAGINGNNGGGGGGSRGGGGGGSSGPSAADVAARNAALDAILQQQLDAINGSYAGQGSALDQLLASQNQGYDQRQGQLGSIQTGADQRLSSILGELNTGAGAARGATSAAFAQGDQRLQALQNEYSQMASQRDASANQTLGAFGAASGGASGTTGPTGSGVQDMMMAGRTANTMRGNAADQLYAQRGNVYNGLNADAKTQNGQTFDMLLGQLANQRQATAAQVAQQKAALALQQAQQVAQARITDSQNRMP